MIRRAAIIALAAVSVAAAALAMIATYVFSPAGRGALATFAERRIERVVGGKVEIGSLTGDLTRRVELNDVRFLSDGNEWASIGIAAIDWSPAALLSHRVEIRALEIEDCVILAQPPAHPRKEPFKGFELPESLPAIAIDHITLRNVQVAGELAHEPLRLDGEGSAVMGGAALLISARAREAQGRDAIAIELRRESASNAPALKIEVSSAADGAVAALSKAQGAVRFSAKGSGPLHDYRIDFSAAAGGYGTISGVLSSDIAALDAIAFDVAASPGARFFRFAADLGDQIALSGALTPLVRGARLEITQINGAFGNASGEVEWRNGDRALADAVVNLRAHFAPNWRPALQGVIGDEAAARIALERRGRDYRGAASVTAPAASARLKDLTTNLRTRLTGNLSAALGESSSLAGSARSRLQGAAALSLSAGDGLNLNGAKITAANGAAFEGGARLRFEGSAFEVAGKVAVTPSAVKAFAPAVSMRNEAAGDIEASGTFEEFGLNLSLRAPETLIGASALPASVIALSLEKSSAALEGALSVRASDGSLQSSARIRRESNGEIALADIAHRGNGFALTGAAAFNPATREGSVDLRYSGADGAEPWPGLKLTGEASVKGALEKTNKNSWIDIQAPSLRTQSFSLVDLSLTAKGPAERLSFVASAARLSVQERAHVDNLQLQGSAAIAGAVTITLAAVSADVQGEAARLQRPAVISFAGGVAIDDLALRVGEQGAVDISSAANPRRWRASVAIRSLGVIANDAALNFDLALDTDRAAMAAGKFWTSSGRPGETRSALRGAYSWDGRTLSVTAGGDDSALAFSLEAPLALRRAGRLSVSMNGGIRGTASYNGRVETIALFLPPPLQSLEGDLSFNGTLGGTVKDPRVEGALTFSDGAFTEAVSGLSIVGIDLTAAAAATPERSTVTFKGAANGPGQTRKTVTAAGKMTLRDGVTITADIGLQGARFSAGPVQRVEATGKLSIAGDAAELLVSGDVSLSALEATLFTPENLGLVDINVVAAGAGGEPVTEAGASPRRTALRYDVRIDADDNVTISGRGLNSEWRASALISGTSSRPLILGTMNLDRGDLEFSGRRFDLTRGSIGFDTLAPNDPTIDIRAERETRDGASVAVVISGRSSALKVSLESTPSLPSDDVMALILFDKPADELSAFQSLQVADALTQLGGVGVFGGKGFAGAARDAIGLDLLNIDVDQTDTSASLLTVGKYVTDGLFVSASQNARGENGSLRIEYEIGQSFSVETELRQDGDQTVSANWKKDF